MNRILKVDTFVEKQNLINQDSILIVGLSGGPDSTFLLHYLSLLSQKKNLTLIAAHLDHEWRVESDKDVLFCADIAERYNIKFIREQISSLDLPFTYRGSKEEYGRKARQFFFNKLRLQYNADAIVLGHHFNDQQETFFIRLIRGASLTGLIGMQPKRDHYIRPLLPLHKDEILAFLHENNIAYLTDPSNESFDYLRNRIRHTALPALRSIDTRFDTTFAHTLANLSQTEDFLQQETERIFNTITLPNDNTEIRYIQIVKLLALHQVMLHRIILHWLCTAQVSFTPTTKFFNEIVRFLRNTQSHTHVLHHNWSLKKMKHNNTQIIYINKKNQLL